MNAHWRFFNVRRLPAYFAILPIQLAVTSLASAQANTPVIQPSAWVDPAPKTNAYGAILNEIFPIAYRSGHPSRFIQPQAFSSRRFFFARYYSRQPKPQPQRDIYHSTKQLLPILGLPMPSISHNSVDLSLRRIAPKIAWANVDSFANAPIIGTWEISHSPLALTYDSCFKGDENAGSCATCGYYESEMEAKGPYNCITCSEGYELDVVFDDCSGFCVPLGTATTPLSR